MEPERAVSLPRLASRNAQQTCMASHFGDSDNVVMPSLFAPAAFPVEISIGAPCGALLDDDDDDDDDGAASVCLFGRG